MGNRLTSPNLPNLTYDNSNKLINDSDDTYTYDANGNMLTKTDSSGTTHFSWDFENHLTSVTRPDGNVTSFGYDPIGRRIQKNAAVYLYDGVNLVEETDNSGNRTAKYTFGGVVDEPLAAYRGGLTSFYEADGLRSITSLSTPAGLVSDVFVYNSFGETTTSDGSFNQPFRFTGRELDPETGLYYYRARYYDAAIGRFISEDPLRNAAGPNYYAYVHNNALNSTDPSGLLDVFIWYFKGSKQAWGHASLSLDNGEHISWWPSPDDRQYLLGTDKIPIYTAPANEQQELSDDIAPDYEGQLPDEIIHIEGLDENAIAEWWANFQHDRRWKTLSRNCSTTVALALRAGGAKPMHHVIWTPANVAKYAESVAQQQPGSGFVPSSVYFPELQPIVFLHGAPLTH